MSVLQKVPQRFRTNSQLSKSFWWNSFIEIHLYKWQEIYSFSVSNITMSVQIFRQNMCYSRIYSKYFLLLLQCFLKIRVTKKYPTGIKHGGMNRWWIDFWREGLFPTNSRFCIENSHPKILFSKFCYWELNLISNELIISLCLYVWSVTI